MRQIRLFLPLAVLTLVALAADAGLTAAGRVLRSQAEARQLVALALGSGRLPAQREELLRRARELDPRPGVADCAEGGRLERWGHWEEAAASFRRCLASDPQQPYPHLAYAQALRRARGREAYVEARAELCRFLEGLGKHPGPSDPASRRDAEEGILDLEDLLSQGNPRKAARLTGEEIVEILTRPWVRGASRYEGPRVPLHLGFRPGDVTLGAAAEAQLQAVAQALRDGSLAADRVLIEGHTDSIEGGSREARLALARQRAQAVRHYLVFRCGIAARRLSTIALADDYPLEPNESEPGRDANRRVDLVDLEAKTILLHDVRDR
jgi:outer membrane protein OmpA-like peptidoglycan-associated protein